MTRTYTSLFGLATLAVLGLAAAPTAHAQTLNLNDSDNVTVSGAGTVGTINTRPVANTTTTYTDSDNFYAVRTNSTAAFTLGTGGTLTATQSEDTALFAIGSSAITISGGTITGGSVGFGLVADGSGPVTITGGTITAGTNGFGLFTGGSSAIDLYGAFDGLALGQTQTLPSGNSSGSFTGTLENNTAPQTFTYANSGSITLHDIAAAPEPSAWAAFAVGVLGLGALGWKAKRRTA